MKKILLIIALLISGLGLNAQIYDTIEIDYGTHSLYYTFQIDYSYEIHFDSVFHDGDYYYYYDTLVYADTSVGVSYCYNYSNVLSITIPSTENGFNVTSIGDYSFAWHENLIEIEIPSSVTSIGGGAFYGCYNLRSIVCHAEEVPATEFYYYYDNPFYECYDMTIYVPENSVGLYQESYPWNNYTIKSIDEYEEPFNPFLEFTIDYEMYSLRYESDPIFDNITGQLSGDVLKVAGIDVYAEGLSVEIPSKVTYNDKEYTVTSIGDYAFNNCYNLTNIEIPSSVTSIGSSAFNNCYNLTSIELPSGVTSIGYEAFGGCSSLTNIEIPSSVTSIGNYAFYNCHNLTSIEIPNSVTYIGESAFRGCSLTSIEIPSGVTSIGSSTFYECSSLTSIEIPNSVTSIGDYAFYYCYNLTSLICHSENVPYAEDFTFYECYNMTIYVPKNSVGLYQETYPWNNYTIEPIVERDPGTPDYTMDFGAYFLNFEITNTELAECELSYASEPKVQTTLTIPSSVTIEGEVYSVTSIGDSAFLGCDKFIGDLIIPNTVTSVGIRAFRDCVGFTSLTLSENLKTIKDLAFAGGGIIHVNYAGELTIPSSVEYIGLAAFQNCSSLTSLKFEENSQLTSIEQNAFRNCSGFTGDLVIPNSVNYIGEYAFWECAGFDGTLTLSVNIDTISDCAFAAYGNAMNFTGDLVIPSSVEYIGLAAFQNCSSLTSLKFEENSQLTSIGNYAFSGCSSLTSIEFEENSLLTSIGGYAFAGCSSLTSIEIPSSVTSIGDYAFSSCSSLTSIYCYAEIVPETGSYVFASCPSAMVIYVPAISVNAYKATSPWNNYTIMPLSCAVTASSNPEEAGVITGTGEYELSDTVTLTATANEGYKFVSWTENGELVSIEKEFSFVVTTNRNFVANFEKTYEITATVNPEKVGVVIGSGVYFKGDNVTLTAIAMEGYKFVNWTEDGEVVSENAQYSFVVEGNRNLVANFDKKELVGTVTYNVTTTVNPEKVGVVIGSGLYFKGDNVTLTAIPIKNGYEFVNWTEDGEEVSTDAQYSFVIESDRELVANFVLLDYYVSVAVSSAEAGEVTGDGNYNHGDTVALIATANEGYAFVNWTEDGEVVSSVAEYSFVILKDRNIVANFEKLEDPEQPEEPGEGVEELVSSFNIYPNPVSDKLYIETQTQTLTVEIYDVYGRQQSMVNGQQSTVIDVSDLNSGVYFVKVVTSEGEAVKRFVKNNS